MTKRTDLRKTFKLIPYGRACMHACMHALIAKLLGISQDTLLPVIKAKMVDDVKAKPTASFLRIQLSNIDGGFIAKPIIGGSSVLTTLTGSNGYTIVPGRKGIKKGETVKVTLFSKLEFANLRPLKRGVPE